MRVAKNLPRPPSFAPITEDELTNAFMRGWAVRNGQIPNPLHQRPNAPEERPVPVPAEKRHRVRKRKGESEERVTPPEPPRKLRGQQPQKKTKVEKPRGA